jgi:hypothetical protein
MIDRIFIHALQRNIKTIKYSSAEGTQLPKNVIDALEIYGFISKLHHIAMRLDIQ